MNQNLLLVAVAVVAAAFLVRMIFLSRPNVTPAEAHAAVAAGAAVIVDVREPSEWVDGIVADAALLPLSDLRGARAKWEPFLTAQRGKQILLYCHSGARSGMAAATLRKEGFAAANLGGFSVCARGGLPVRRG